MTQISSDNGSAGVLGKMLGMTHSVDGNSRYIYTPDLENELLGHDWGSSGRFELAKMWIQ